MVEQPQGTVTLVFSDIEGSTKLLEALGTSDYRQALAEHRQIVRQAFARYRGYEVDYEGDAFFYAFASAQEAVSAVSDAMQGLEAGPISIRVGIHTGEPELDPPKYVGMDVHTAARIMSCGHGGQVVVSPTTAALLDTPLQELGEHRLKDIPEAVPIFQLGDGSFPPLKTISNTNLPTPASSFVGRDDELLDVLSRFEEGARLVTLTGPGGTGKTRLAIEAAATLVPEYKAGVFWVGLATLRDPALVAETIAQALGAKDGLADHIGDREILLLLDNFEQVVGAAPEFSRLLTACPNLTLLVTSRELLRIQGEVEYSVPPLAEREAVELFSVRSQLEPDDTILELCRRLDDMPLAVELAAARTTVLTPEQILERLSQRLDLLKGGRDADPRQQTLRATIEWSYELLSPEEQQFFARLSVFAGCTLEAAEEVAEAEMDMVQSLVHKSLVRFTAGRYWMLETIREYAGERLEKAGEKESYEERHAAFYLAFAEEAELELYGEHTDVWLPRLDAEEANFRAALGSATRREEAEVALRLSGSLYPFWEIRGSHGEARVWLNRALALDGTVAPSCRAKALVAAGRAAMWQFDWLTAIPILEEAAELSRKLNDVGGVGRCFGFIGHTRMFTGDLEGATAVLNEGVELARSTGDRANIARALYNAAWAAIEQREFDRAREMFEEAAATYRAVGMKPNLALSLMRLGYSEALAGNFDRAASRLTASVELFDELGKTLWTPVAQRYLGLLALLEGKIDEAESLLRESLVEGRDEAPQFDLPHWIEELAAVASAKGQAQRAAVLWGATDALVERFGLATLEENRQVRELFRNDAGGSHDGDPYADARAEGRAMTLHQAIAYAVTEPAA